LADSNTVAVTLPGASLGLGMPYAPARKLLDAGACLAIASDWNPGSAPMGDLLMQAATMSASEKLTTAEVLAGLTYRAAAALKITNRGILAPGMLADMQAYPCADYREILYYQGKMKPSKPYKWVGGNDPMTNEQLNTFWMNPMNKLIECVPNFSEGVNLAIIKQITDEIETVEGVRLLNVDPGKATNRTVVTFVGEPSAVIQAAFLAIKKAGELIDMSKHKGEHPRMGATDVCPLIPIANITMEETAEYAKQLAKRVGGGIADPGVFIRVRAAG
jgi:hypothetical protein